MFDFRKTSMLEELFGGINAGQPGCFGVKREPDFDNCLALYTQKRRTIVTDFLLDVRRSDGQRFVFDQTNFQGVLIMDGRGEKQSRVRFVMVDTDGTLQLASDCDQFHGQIIIVADQAVSADPKLFGVKALFGEDEEGTASMLLWDGSKELTKLWTMEVRLMRSEVCGIDMRSI